jgi:membrane protein DedA with SNARE-associated domain
LAHERVSWPLALGALFLGIFLGDLGLYLFGRGVRRGLFRKRDWSFSPSALDLCIARFVPGMRTLTFTGAGLCRFPMKIFVTVGLVSSLIWTALLLSSTQWLVHQLSGVPAWAWVAFGFFLMGLGHVGKSFSERYVSGKRTMRKENP